MGARLIGRVAMPGRVLIAYRQNMSLNGSTDMENADRRGQAQALEGKRPWRRPRIKTLRVLSTRAGNDAVPGVDEDNYINDNPDNRYTPIS